MMISRPSPWFAFRFGLAIFSFLMSDASFAQDTLGTRIIYDRPNYIRYLFAGVQPFYGEYFSTSSNAGWGLDAHYLPDHKADYRLQFRRPYAESLLDVSRENAAKNSKTENTPTGFYYLEASVNIHFRDVERKGHAKVILYNAALTKNAWSATVPRKVKIPSKVRKIYGFRAGAIQWRSTMDVSTILERQGLSNADIFLPEIYRDALGRDIPLRGFSSMTANTFYLGTGVTTIRNVAVEFNHFENTLDDGILVLYADLMYSPALKIDPVLYLNTPYPVNKVSFSSLGFRAGLDGKFNRHFGWGFGAEAGVRPGPTKQGFFANVKVTVPMFGSFLFRRDRRPNEHEDIEFIE